MADIIAESLYAQYDLGGNEYFLLDSFIIYKKTDKVLIAEDQLITVKGKPVIRKSTAG